MRVLPYALPILAFSRIKLAKQKPSSSTLN
jgi:hypothetical protein